MKTSNIFSRISVFMFMLISMLSVLFIIITYITTTHFYEESTQLLNKDVAAHIAKFSSPFGKDGIDKRKADSVFYHAMVISPNDEVYFLDTTGKVIYYHSADSLIREWLVPLGPVRSHIQKGGKDYIKNLDPRDPAILKIFSAAEVRMDKKIIGYIYVVLGGNQYRTVSDLLSRSHIFTLATQAFIIAIILSVALSVFYFKRLQGNFNKVIITLERFKEGDYLARFDTTKGNELNSILSAFNSLADRLAETIDRLKRSEDERKDFITNISHDLRTPLAIAKGYTETLLLENNQSDQVTAHLQVVENKIQVVENLVMQLFELSKMESAEFKPNREPFIIAEILKEIAASWELPAQSKNIRLECLGCESPMMICADIGMIERVVRNLLGNAFKFTPVGGFIQIRLSEEGGRLILDFVNNGPAIPEEVISWIIRDTNSRVILKRPAKSGLGLAIVKRILEVHNYPLNIHTSRSNRVSVGMEIYKAPGR